MSDKSGRRSHADQLLDATVGNAAIMRALGNAADRAPRLRAAPGAPGNHTTPLEDPRNSARSGRCRNRTVRVAVQEWDSRALEVTGRCRDGPMDGVGARGCRSWWLAQRYWPCRSPDAARTTTVRRPTLAGPR